MKNKKPYFQFYSIFYLVLFCLIFIKLSVSGQTPDAIEQDRGSRVFTNQVNPDLQNRLPQRNLRRTIPVEMLELQLVTVPQLVGRIYNLDQITSILNRYGLRLGSVVPVANNDSIGLITSQSPGVRQLVKPQTPINITYGIELPLVTPVQPQTVQVPNYVGLTIERAVGRMPNDRLTPGNISEINSDERPGIVVNQFPEPGTPVDPGTEISIGVSIGPQPEIAVRVPRLIGITLQQAAEVLRGSELFVGSINEQISDQSAGIIIEQSPGPETVVLRGSAINIVYSVRADEELIPVPYVIQLFQDEAIRVIKENDLNYLIEYVNEPGQSKGVVVYQNPQPDTMVETGSFVTIFINDKSGIPPWIYWAGGVLAAGLFGGFIGKNMNAGKKKKMVGEKDVKIKLKPVLDTGKQTLTHEENPMKLNNMHIKFISDAGTQILKTD